MMSPRTAVFVAFSEVLFEVVEGVMTVALIRVVARRSLDWGRLWMMTKTQA